MNFLEFLDNFLSIPGSHGVYNDLGFWPFDEAAGAVRPHRSGRLILQRVAHLQNVYLITHSAAESKDRQDKMKKYIYIFFAQKLHSDIVNFYLYIFRHNVSIQMFRWITFRVNI